MANVTILEELPFFAGESINDMPSFRMIAILLVLVFGVGASRHHKHLITESKTREQKTIIIIEQKLVEAREKPAIEMQKRMEAEDKLTIETQKRMEAEDQRRALSWSCLLTGTTGISFGAKCRISVTDEHRGVDVRHGRPSATARVGKYAQWRAKASLDEHPGQAWPILDVRRWSKRKLREEGQSEEERTQKMRSRT